MNVSEILYGGAAGGGKSDWLLMEALRYVSVPGYNALLLRRTFPQLSQADGLIERSKEWLYSTPAKWSEGKRTWTFPSGATLMFGHMQLEDDRLQYQGGAFQMVGYDELTHFSEGQYTYLFSRLRRLEGVELPLRMRAASNPGGVGHDWVRKRFLLEPNDNRLFIPSKIDDNPYLDREEYELALQELHPYEREQLLSGNWDAKPPGSKFQRNWFNVIENAPFDARKTVRAWDLAATEPKGGKSPDYSVGVKLSMTQSDRIAVEHVVRDQISPHDLDTLILRTARHDGPDTVIWIEEEPGASGKVASTHFVKLLKGFTVHTNRPTGSKAVRANPVASYAEAGLIDVVRGEWNEDFLRELELFTGTKDDSHDDQVDALSLGFAKLCLKKGVSPEDLYGANSQLVA
jgi:predicted phage terminase large subunit-like protein